MKLGELKDLLETIPEQFNSFEVLLNVTEADTYEITNLDDIIDSDELVILEGKIKNFDKINR